MSFLAHTGNSNNYIKPGMSKESTINLFVRHNDEDDRFNNICLKNGAKKAIWKCIPRSK